MVAGSGEHVTNVADGAVRLVRLGSRLAIVATRPGRPDAWVVYRIEPGLAWAAQLVATFAVAFHRGAG
ncbi:hypothetical protein [Methylobacterium nigriterrae]|uniref:hypothetical protein n=1 Tax=Methylobacterium nigriterrae TaxID=3127512 RepID=UPI00301385C1